MKLQKQITRKVDSKEYSKWVVVIPPDRIKKLGWKEGIELKDILKKDSLCLKPKNPNEIEKVKEQPIYNDFKKSIKSLLQRYPAGLTWGKIKDKLNLYQKAPNNKWVRDLEKDIGLTRIKRSNKTIWKIEHNTIYTIGYEGLKIEEFIRKLKDYNMELVVDVREIALSRKNGFSKTKLKQNLKEAGIRYKHIRTLGSPKSLRKKLKNDWDYEKFFKEYRKHIKDEDVQASITDLEGFAKMRKTVIMCFEKDYKTCHRSIITEELKKRGWQVNHLR